MAKKAYKIGEGDGMEIAPGFGPADLGLPTKAPKKSAPKEKPRYEAPKKPTKPSPKNPGPKTPRYA